MTTTVPTPPTPPKTAPHEGRRRWGLALIVLLLFVGIGLALTLPGYFGARTDDAYVEADVVTVAPKVGGYVTRLDVDDNAHFAAESELVQIDDRDYRNAVASAQADLESAKAVRMQVMAQLANQAHSIAAARATLIGDQAQMQFSRQQVARYGPLAQGGYGSLEHLQQVQADNGQRLSTLEKDSADVQSAEAQVEVIKANLLQADADIARRSAALAQAQLNLSYTKITADFDGTVADRIVRVGAYVQPGQALLSEVPARTYIIANYKETQLARMQSGQPVSIHVDAFPLQTFRGHIDSFQRGTGSRFALLPPENSTGNFVKVVQRVPVKIVFDEPTDRLARLAPGMSVEAIVSWGAGKASARSNP